MQDAWGNMVVEVAPMDNVTVNGQTVLPGLLEGNVTTLQLQSASGEPAQACMPAGSWIYVAKF